MLQSINFSSDALRYSFLDDVGQQGNGAQAYYRHWRGYRNSQYCQQTLKAWRREGVFRVLCISFWGADWPGTSYHSPGTEGWVVHAHSWRWFLGLGSMHLILWKENDITFYWRRASPIAFLPSSVLPLLASRILVFSWETLSSYFGRNAPLPTNWNIDPRPVSLHPWAEQSMIAMSATKVGNYACIYKYMFYLAAWKRTNYMLRWLKTMTYKTWKYNYEKTVLTTAFKDTCPVKSTLIR